MKFVTYDSFATMRFRYPNGAKDVSIMADNTDKWWYGDWDSYIFNMIEDIQKADESICGWESVMITIPDWLEDKFALHTFYVWQEVNKVEHEIHTFNE